jgi:hypothetical protein
MHPAGSCIVLDCPAFALGTLQRNHICEALSNTLAAGVCLCGCCSQVLEEPSLLCEQQPASSSSLSSSQSKPPPSAPLADKKRYIQDK